MQAGGRRFDPVILHQNLKTSAGAVLVFGFWPKKLTAVCSLTKRKKVVSLVADKEDQRYV